DPGLQLVHLALAGTPERDAAGERKLNGTADRNICGRSGRSVNGALNAFALGLGNLWLGEIRELEVVAEEIDEFVAAQHEAEGVLAVAFAWTGALRAALPGARQIVALDELLVPGQHHVARAAFAAEARLVHAVERDRDLTTLQDVLDIAFL